MQHILYNTTHMQLHALTFSSLFQQKIKAVFYTVLELQNLSNYAMYSLSEYVLSPHSKL